MDKSRFLDNRGRPLTQGLFLEIGYNIETAIYTLDEYDKEYKGVVYPSLKQLYLNEYDPNEYIFVSKYLYSWKQWQRLLANRLVRNHIDEWRDELELKVASEALQEIVSMSTDDKGFQAAKYLADRSWNKRGVGRPKKDTSERDKKLDERLNEEFNEDLARVVKLRG